MFFVSNSLPSSCNALLTLFSSFNRAIPLPRFSLIPPVLSSPASKSPARELVSQSALSVFDDSKCTDVEFRGNRTRVRDVTLAVVTISILRFEPPRIARWLQTGPWRKRHADTNENECRERSEYNAKLQWREHYQKYGESRDFHVARKITIRSTLRNIILITHFVIIPKQHGIQNRKMRHF